MESDVAHIHRIHCTKTVSWGTSRRMRLLVVWLQILASYQRWEETSQCHRFFFHSTSLAASIVWKPGATGPEILRGGSGGCTVCKQPSMVFFSGVCLCHGALLIRAGWPQAGRVWKDLSVPQRPAQLEFHIHFLIKDAKIEVCWLLFAALDPGLTEWIF